MSNRLGMRAAGPLLLICGLSTALANPPTSAPATTNRAGATAPSMDDIKQLIANHQYADALIPLQRMMALQGHDADAFSRHEVLMLVAECRLQLRRVPDCLGVLDLAVREARKSNNWPHRAEALSLATLLRAAPKLAYAPKASEDHTPLDLTDSSQRRTAYETLCEEKQAFCDEQVRLVRETASVKPLTDVADAF